MPKQPTIPEGTYTFDPLLRDPTFTPFHALPHRGEHGWLTRRALEHGHRERWEMGMWDVYLWDVYLYLHKQLNLYCVVAYQDGVEMARRDYEEENEVVDRDYKTLTAARHCFADWARYAAIEQATRVLEL